MNGIFISGDVCKKSLDHLIFQRGNVNTFSNKQVVNIYEGGFNDFEVKFFQIEDIIVHSSKRQRIYFIIYFVIISLLHGKMGIISMMRKRQDSLKIHRIYRLLNLFGQ